MKRKYANRMPGIYSQEYIKSDYLVDIYVKLN